MTLIPIFKIGLWNGWIPLCLLYLIFGILLVSFPKDVVKKQKSMSVFLFQIMKLIMHIRKHFRNIKKEIEFAGTEPGKCVLDFGCGFGFNTIPAAFKISNNGKIYALDIHPLAIKSVENKIKKYGLKNIITIISDCDAGLEDESIDIVYLHNVLPLIEDKNLVINELHRILKIHGKLSIMSRIGSRIIGDNMLNDKNLKEYLERESKFRLIKSKKTHFVFEKCK